MENTGKALFEDDSSPQWFIALGEQWMGPLSAQDIYDKILSHELTWAHFVWREGQSDWKRICETPTFQAAVPGAPARGVQQKVREIAAAPQVKEAQTGRQRRPGATKPGAASVEERLWFLYYNDAQFGPFSEEEIARFLRIGKIHGRVYAWKDGLPDWERLEKIGSFDEAVSESERVRSSSPGSSAPAPQFVPGQETTRTRDVTSAPEERSEQRKAPRSPMVARILLAHEKDQSVNVAICRDISIGGMQVLTDRVPGPIGTRIKLNVSPPGEGVGASFRPFVAQGVIVRILEDGRGFSFRFERLRADAKRAIEEYIEQLA